MQDDNVSFEQPYPLKDRFYKIILPGLCLVTLVIGLIMGSGSSWLTEEIYLEISEQRAAIIDRALVEKDPESWIALQSSIVPQQVFGTMQGRHLLETLRDEVKELGLSHLKVYGQDGVLLYSSEETQIGSKDPSRGYLNALKGVRTLVKKETPEGKNLYELYVKVPNAHAPVVMELYEPVDYLDAITQKVIVPAMLIPVGVLVLVTLAMGRLVHHAQRDINYRTNLLSDFRERLQRLVSKEAVETIRSSAGKGQVASRRVRVTILFSDVRGFTDFCENETPENVVAFLNRSLGVVIDAVRENGGDVDKMIGDAVLAHFQGEGSEKRALTAACDAMRLYSDLNLPRGIGIGLYTGDVVVGTVGVQNRMDFTVIGDTVNVASRLCSAAREGEIVIDQDSAEQAGLRGGVSGEEIMVKGREKALQVFRLSEV